MTLSGHSGAVTALGFSSSGGLLASGSADTSLIVWDVVGEAGLVRLKGHRDAVTDLVRHQQCGCAAGLLERLAGGWLAGRVLLKQRALQAPCTVVLCGGMCSALCQAAPLQLAVSHRRSSMAAPA